MIHARFLAGAVLLITSQVASAQLAQNPGLRAAGSGPIANPTGPAAPAAVLTAFTDRNTWAAAVGGSTTLVDFEAIAAGTLVTNQLAPYGISGVSGTAILESPPGATTQFIGSSGTLPFPMYIAGTLPSETNFISNRMSAGVYATGRITFTFSTPVLAVGAYVADQSPLANFVIEVFNGPNSLGMIVDPPATLPLSFVGLTSDTPFTSATFYPQSDYDSWGLDNVELSASSPATTFCSGDGSGTACPCGNSGAAGNGCASSVSATGAHLAGSGFPSIANDSFTLTGSLMPNSSALYFQGTTPSAGGLGAMFGDGLRCAGGTVTRLGTKTNVSGGSSYPTAGNASISVKGANSAGAVRTYQCWYRNAAAFCTPSTFNLSNGVQITWSP
jgi:hypothetical protein